VRSQERLEGRAFLQQHADAGASLFLLQDLLPTFLQVVQPSFVHAARQGTAETCEEGNRETTLKQFECAPHAGFAALGLSHDAREGCVLGFLFEFGRQRRFDVTRGRAFARRLALLALPLALARVGFLLTLFRRCFCGAGLGRRVDLRFALGAGCVLFRRL